MDEWSVFYGITSLIAVIFYIVFFVWTSKNSPTGNSTTHWGDIKKDVFSSWVAPTIAIIFSFVSLAYLIRYPDLIVYVLLGLSCLMVGISVSALSFSIVSR